MKLMAMAAVSLILATVVGCGSSQEPDAVSAADAGDSGSHPPAHSRDGGTTPGDSEADSSSDAGHDADNPADPVLSCFDCPRGQTLACANLCTEIGGFIAGDGEPYRCCHW